MLKNFPVYNSV